MSFWLFLAICLSLAFGILQPFLIYLGIFCLVRMEKEAGDE